MIEHTFYAGWFMIDGLTYIPNYLSTEDGQLLIHKINQQTWISNFKRRVLHYGYIYDYKRRTIDRSMYLGDLPEWTQSLARRLLEDSYFIRQPDQIIINEYEVGQGIASHVDCEPCFGDVIASISLGSTCLMEFTHAETKTKHQLLLEPNSLLVMSATARYEWKHGIPARKTDRYNGRAYARQRRLSLTFRTVILED